MKVTEIAHEWVRRAVRPGDAVVDATVGNGHDTVFLAELVGPEGTVTGFDLQEEAIEEARARIGGERVILHCAGHERLSEWVAGPVRAVMFNLGYLPGGDKGVVTRPATTVAALEQAAVLLAPGGIVTIVVYTGHAGGAEEGAAVQRFCDGLDAGNFEVLRPPMVPGAPENAPYLIAIVKAGK